MSIEVECVNYDQSFSFSDEEIQALFQSLSTHDKFPGRGKSLEIAFVDESLCCQLHQQFFDDPSLTDVMTFPSEDPEDEHFGDIAVCPLVAKQVSQESSLSFSEELCLYLVHGWLHLHGLLDQTEEDITIMRKAEAELMDFLSEKDLIPSFQYSPV